MGLLGLFLKKKRNERKLTKKKVLVLKKLNTKYIKGSQLIDAGEWGIHYEGKVKVKYSWFFPKEEWFPKSGREYKCLEIK